MPNKLLEISSDELAELRRKAKAYDEMLARRSAGGKKAWTNLSAEERSARAKKAVAARIKKYNQSKRDAQP